MAANPLHILLYKTYADLKAESKRTHAGMLWWIGEPLLHMVVYYIVFAVFFQRGGEDFIPFLLVGLVVWRWFQVTLMQGSASIRNGRKLMLQVHLRKTLFPASVILANSYKFAITLVLLLLFLWVYGLGISWYYAALPALLIIQLMLVMGCTYIAAALIPFLPDLRVLLDNALRAMLFLSGIFYAGDNLPEHIQPWFYLNPMAVLIDAYRDVLMYAQWPDWTRLNWVACLALVLILIGKWLIGKLDYQFPKVAV